MGVETNAPVWGPGRIHLSVFIGEVKKAAGNFYGERLVGIEGEKPDARNARMIIDIGAEIEFHEVR